MSFCCVVMLIVVMLIVVTLSVVAPFYDAKVQKERGAGERFDCLCANLNETVLYLDPTL